MAAGFGLCVAAMIAAGVVETQRKFYSRTYPQGQGGYNNPSALANASPCVSLADYNPGVYQAWWQYRYAPGGSAALGLSYQGFSLGGPPPSHCSQVCDDTHVQASDALRSGPGDLLQLNGTCIACDNLPQKSELSVWWQVSIWRPPPPSRRRADLFWLCAVMSLY
jgi:hypothetical protein